MQKRLEWRLLLAWPIEQMICVVYEEAGLEVRLRISRQLIRVERP